MPVAMLVDTRCGAVIAAEPGDGCGHSEERLKYLATSSAGQARDHHIHRFTEGDVSQGLLAADITKPDIRPLKVLQSRKKLSRASEV